VYPVTQRTISTTAIHNQGGDDPVAIPFAPRLIQWNTLGECQSRPEIAIALGQNSASRRGQSMLAQYCSPARAIFDP
jgi:hypothetical protein